MNYYESLFILHPEMGSTETDEIINRMEGVVRSNGGEVAHAERWGKRKLAYKVRNQRFGYYVLMHVSIEPPGLKELERNFRMSERVLKYQNVRIRREDVGKVTLDREVMEEAIVEAAQQEARGRVAGPAAVTVSEPAAVRAAEPEAAGQEGSEEAPLPQGAEPSASAPVEADETGRASPSREET